ncbi:putative histone H2A.5, partial [Cucurbita argyrosperma subsp. argyrosperma]
MISNSFKAALQCLDGRTRRYLKKGRYEKRTSVDALIYLVVVPKYLASMVLKLATNVTRDNKKNKINSRHPLPKALATATVGTLAIVRNGTLYLRQVSSETSVPQGKKSDSNQNPNSIDKASFRACLAAVQVSFEAFIDDRDQISLSLHIWSPTLQIKK